MVCDVKIVIFICIQEIYVAKVLCCFICFEQMTLGGVKGFSETII